MWTTSASLTVSTGLGSPITWKAPLTLSLIPALNQLWCLLKRSLDQSCFRAGPRNQASSCPTAVLRIRGSGQLPCYTSDCQDSYATQWTSQRESRAWDRVVVSSLEVTFKEMCFLPELTFSLQAKPCANCLIYNKTDFWCLWDFAQTYGHLQELVGKRTLPFQHQRQVTLRAPCRLRHLWQFEHDIWFFFFFLFLTIQSSPQIESHRFNTGAGGLTLPIIPLLF